MEVEKSLFGITKSEQNMLPENMSPRRVLFWVVHKGKKILTTSRKFSYTSLLTSTVQSTLPQFGLTTSPAFGGLSGKYYGDLSS